jgi:hypothetical protein
VDHPLSPVAAKSLALTYLEERTVEATAYASMRLTTRGADVQDCLNVIRGGKVTDRRQVKGEWRYRFETETFYAVVSFKDTETMQIITAVKKGARTGRKFGKS